MALQEHFERSGAWLFRWRSYLPVALFAVPVQTLLTDGASAARALQPAWAVTVLGVGLLGLAVRVATVGTAPGNTSGRNTHAQIADVLNTTGSYSLVRHPLYVGNFLMWLAPALLPGAWQAAALVSLAFWLYYERIMSAEEAFLRARFGAAFIVWAAATPAFWPTVRGVRHAWRPPALRFSWRIVLRREYSGLLGLVGSLALLDLIATWRVTGRAGLSAIWLVALGIAAPLYLTLRTLKRRSHLLDVPGR